MRGVVAIDGPAASGKTTTARLVAQELGFMHLDTGAMYRAVTLACLRKQLPPEETPQLLALLEDLDVHTQPGVAGQSRVLLNGQDVTEAIRGPQVTQHVSNYSAMPAVREKMVALQRQVGIRHNVVCEGRDIGTRVFPRAQHKFFLVADLEVRARRRYEELQAQGFTPSLETIITELHVRDREDATRRHSPLKQAKDAVAVDTTHLSIKAQVDLIVNLINEKRPGES